MLASIIGQAVFDAIIGPTTNDAPISCKVAAAASPQNVSHGR